MQIGTKVAYNNMEGIIYDLTTDNNTVWIETKEDLYKADATEVEVIEEELTTAIINHINNTEAVDTDWIEEAIAVAEDIITKYNITVDNINLHKLDRKEKEEITGLDYRESKITTDYITKHHAHYAIVYTLTNIIIAQAEGKAINRLIRKWIVD